MQPADGARGRISLGITSTERIVGGIASNNRNVVAAMARLARDTGRGLSITSLWDDPGGRPQNVPPDVDYVACGGSKARFSLRLFTASAGADVSVLDHVGIALPLLPLAAAGAAKTAIFAHGSEGWWRLTRTGRWSFRRASLVLTNSSYTLRRMREAFDGFNGRVCQLGLPADVALHATPPAPAAPVFDLEAADGERRGLGDGYFLLVGRIDPTEGRKGHRQMVRALAAMPAIHAHTQLVFAGPGEGRAQWARLAQELRVADRVFLPGNLPAQTLQALYRGCRAYAMPSRQEGFGIVYLEAMNWAKACVGCADDGAADVIADGETGLLVRNQEDIGELAGVLRRLLDEPGLAARLGQNGFRRLHAEFTSEKAQRRMIEAIGGMLA